MLGDPRRREGSTPGTKPTGTKPTSARTAGLYLAPAARTPRAARPARQAGDLEPPHRLHPSGVEAAGTRHTRGDHGVIEHGPEDRDLPVEVERIPRSA
jgi:hypothetical protein